MKKASWKVGEITTKTFGQRVSRALVRREFGDTVTRQQLKDFTEKYGWTPQFLFRDPQYRIADGVYRVPADGAPLSDHGPKGTPLRTWFDDDNNGGTPVALEFPEDGTPANNESETDDMSGEAPVKGDHEEKASKDVKTRIAELKRQASALATIPPSLKAFVPYGEYDLMKQILGRKKFMAVFISGLSGCGKTLNIRQACAELKREYIRVNITTETDEDDLLGGFRLKDGETVFEMGPIVVAMLRGCPVLIDEIDKASEKIMCLQPILEGEPITLKKIGVTISPEPGFMIIATANTKGQGDETGKFITSRMLDEATLERFHFTLEHDYPKPEDETEILVKTFEADGGTMTASAKAYFGTLARWAENIRKSYKEGAGDAVISTRRLCMIALTFNALGATNNNNQGRALSLCLNRFDAATKSSFIQLYNKHVNDDGTPSNVGSTKAPKGFA